MSESNGYTVDYFTPASGQILLEPVENTNKFKIKKQSEGLTSESAVGIVLDIGEHFINDFGVDRHKPCKVGDVVLYQKEINQNYLEIDFHEYPVVRFDKILGIILK